MTDSQLIPILRRWWWALLLGTAIAATAGYVAASAATKTYEAQVKLLVGPVNGSIDLEVSGGLARTYADLATSAPILGKALRSAGYRRTVEDVRPKVATSSNAITRIVTVSVRDSSPRVAARLANSIGDRLRRLANKTPPPASTALDSLSHQSELTPLSGDERDAVMLAASRVFGASESGQIQIVQAAAAPLRPASPSAALMTVLAALAGLCLAAFVVLVQEARVRFRDNEQRTAHTFSGALSVIGDTGAAMRNGLVEIRAGSESAESYRMLAARAQLFAGGELSRSLLVVDSGDGSAAAAVASSLADAVAAEGPCVILADLDPHGSGVTDLLGLEGHAGYTNVVAEPSALSRGDGRLDEALVRRGERLSVLARGTVEPSRAESVARLSSLVDRLRERADIVVLAGPSMTRSSKMIAWARKVDQVCLVVDSQADGDEVHRVVVGLKRLDEGFVGAILNGRRRAPERRPALRAS
jgi:capsular polysaccharide biosynthesis protein